jgi:hypothetical protein
VKATVALGVLLAGCGGQVAGPIPTPIGIGARFHPAATNALVRARAPIRGLRCEPEKGARYGVHVELFAHGLVVIVPPGVGVAPPFRRSGAFVTPRGCTYPLRTLDPTGVIEVRPVRKLTLGDLFAVWGRPLSPTQLVGFRTNTSRPVRAYVGGEEWHGSLTAIPLSRHAEIVLELGPFIPPHRSFLFRPGL